MKQPALGKRISELRKEKGLTQEELVQKCNINVRTIQRIEAGEVQPRSYTIKSILNVLGVEFLENPVQNNTLFSASQKRRLHLAWMFGIVYFIIGFLETAADIYQFTGDSSNMNTILYVLLKLISAVSYVFFFLGFYTIGCVFKNSILRTIPLLLMGLLVLSNCIDVFSRQWFEDTIAINVIVECLVFGSLQLAFGIGLLQLKDSFGRLTQVSGIVEIVAGVLLATVLLAPLGLFLMIPAILLEVLLLYKLSRA